MYSTLKDLIIVMDLDVVMFINLKNYIIYL